MFHYFHNHFQALIRAFIRIRYNLIPSSIMIAIIGITLCLPATGYLIIKNAAQLSSKIEYEAQISIFLDKSISKDQIEFIDSTLKQSKHIQAVYFEPKLKAWEKLQTKLKLNSLDAGISENPLPDAFFVTLNSLEGNTIEDLNQDIQTLEGVHEVIIDSGWIKKLRTILYLVEFILIILGSLLGIVLTVIISNTIRLQTLTYQNEIQVSRLIGATNSFIQRPFIYTGLFYGLGGSIINAGILFAITDIFNRIAYKFENILGGLFLLHNLSIKEYLFFTIISMSIGLLASYYSVSQHLNKLEKNI